MESQAVGPQHAEAAHARREQTETAQAPAEVDAVPQLGSPSSAFGVPPDQRRLAAGLNRKDRPARVKTVLRLQRQLGNGAVQRLVVPPIATGKTLQRAPDGIEPPAPAATSVADKIEIAFKSKDPADVKAIGRDNFSKASEDYRWDFIHTLAFQGWVGPLDEYALEALWGCFQDQLLEKAKIHPDYWEKSLARDKDLLKLPAIKDAPEKFIADVRMVANQYLDKNDAYATREMADLGEAVPGVAAGKDPNARMLELQNAAKLVRAAQAAQKALSEIVVGYDAAHDEDSTPPPVEFNFQGKLPFNFAHGRKPWIANKPPAATYEGVDEQWLTLQTIIDGQQAKYPALYALMTHGEGYDLAKVADGKPQAGRDLILKSLHSLREHIASTKTKVGGDLAYDLKPIHGQLTSGTAKGSSGIDWANPVAKTVAHGVLEAKASHDFWVTLGLSSLAAAAFLIVEITTFGLATPVLIGIGTGIGAGLAAASWEKAYTTAQAAKSSASKDTELVAAGQASAAVTEAVLNTVMAFIDMYAGASAGLRKAAAAAGGIVTDAATAGSARAAIIGLDRVGQMGASQATPLVERAVVELGVEGAMARTSKSAKELLAIVGEGSSVAGRLKDFMALPEELAKLAPEQLGERLALLPAEVRKDPKAAQALVNLAVERLGPLKTVRRAGGWSVLSRAVGEESAAMHSLSAWRNSALADALEVLGSLPATAVGAGAGKTEAELAREFLAGRLGGTVEELGIGGAKPLIAGTGEKDLAKLILEAADRRALAGKGLAGAAPMDAMAAEGAALKDTWQGLSAEQRLDKLFELGNARLREAGLPEFMSKLFVTTDDGAFRWGKWQLQLNRAKVADEKQFAWLLEAVYHEARHAEQIAQVVALKKGEKWTSTRIANKLEIEIDVVDRIKPIEPDSAEGRQAAKWFESIWGASRDARLSTLRTMDDALERWSLTKKMWAAEKNSVLKEGLKDLEREKFEQYVREVNRYKALPEEADAYLVQENFRKAMAEHQQVLTDAMPATVRTP